MAEKNAPAKNKNVAKRGATAKSTSSMPKNATENSEEIRHNNTKRKIWSILLFAIGLLLSAFAFFGNASAKEPSAWDITHGILCGLFGISAFVIGPVIIYTAIMIAKNKAKSNMISKLIQLVFAILLLSAIMQVIFAGRIGLDTDTDIFKSIATVYDQGVALNGGGVFSIFIAGPLLLFGRVGAAIIIILIAFVMIMLLSNVTLLDFLGFISKPFKAAGRKMKETREANKARNKEIIDNEKLTRMQIAERDLQKLNDELPTLDDRQLSILATVNSKDTEVKPSTRDDSKLFEQNKDNADFRNNLNQFIKETPLTEEPPTTTEKATDEATEEAGKAYEVPSIIAASLGVPCEVMATYGEKDSYKPQENTALEEPYILPQNEEKKLTPPVAEAIQSYKDEIEAPPKKAEPVVEPIKYTLPPIDLLNDIVAERNEAEIAEEIHHNSEKLVGTLKSFGVKTTVIGVSRGPSITRYELQPAPGVKISKITSLVDDITMNLAAAGVRIEAPIPGKPAVGVEVPNKKTDMVPIRSMIDSEAFRLTKSKLGAALGLDVSGEVIVADIDKMPHVLIAGTTGSGKSVCVNSIIMGILYRCTPDDVRFIMIDPKTVEFTMYNGIPHLLIPVVTDPKKAASALAWAVTEMESRYKLISDSGVRDIDGYNAKAREDPDLMPIPQIIIFIDELADLMAVSSKEVEESICRIAQKARAAGMHLVIATQRPSVNVVTGLIKANIPSRIALKVASSIDSRTILDAGGAEKLLGRGDMLYSPVGIPKPIRVQGCWVSDKEVSRVVQFIKSTFTLDYDERVMEEIERQAELSAQNEDKGTSSKDTEEVDERFDEAVEAIIESGQASTSYLQRMLKLGYSRAARIMDSMEKMGIIGKSDGSKPREILMTKEDWYQRQMRK